VESDELRLSVIAVRTVLNWGKGYRRASWRTSGDREEFIGFDWARLRLQRFSFDLYLRNLRVGCVAETTVAVPTALL